jgi:hypothetical protein
MLAGIKWREVSIQAITPSMACTHKLRLFGNRWLMFALPPKATKAPKNAISRLLVIIEKRDVAFMAQVLKV